MTHPGKSEGGQRSAARLRASKPTVKRPFNSAAANQKARKKMSQLELATGHSPEWWAEFHRAQRERVLRRHGMAA